MKRAEICYQEIIDHLQRHCTEREIKNFVAEADAFFNLLPNSLIANPPAISQ
jgi:hypothetical protein